MPPKKFKPKQKRDRKAEALARLKQRWLNEHEDPEDEWRPESEPVVTPLLKAVEGGIPRVIEALRAHDDDDAQAFCEAWDECTESDRNVLPLEAVAFASGIGSLRLAEVAQTALFLYGQMRTKLLLASGIPAVVEKSLKIAKTAKGLYDREMMLKAGGVLPVPKGAQIAIQNNYAPPEKNEEHETGPMRWKYPEDRLKEIVAVVSPKELPASTSKPEDQIHFQQNRPTVFEGRNV